MSSTGQDKSSTPLVNQLDLLTKALSGVGITIDNLFTKMDDLLTHPPDKDPTEKGLNAEPPHSHLTTVLISQEYQALALNHRLQTLLDRLEV